MPNFQAGKRFPTHNAAFIHEAATDTRTRKNTNRRAGAFGGTIGGTATFAGGQTWTGTVAPGQNKAMTLAGSYNVVETAFPGYTTTYSADCNSTIALGQTKTCTVTNNDIPAQLRVNKVTVPAIDAGRFNLTIDGTTRSAPGGVGNGGNTGFQLVNAGTHTAGENTTGVTPATSLGGVETTIERRSKLAGQEHIPETLCRLSVGCEHVEDLWADIEQALGGSVA